MNGDMVPLSEPGRENALPLRHELPLRIVSSLVLGPAVVVILSLGGLFFQAFIVIGSLIAMQEWLAVVRRVQRRQVWAIWAGLGVVWSLHAAGFSYSTLLTAIGIGLLAGMMARHRYVIDRFWLGVGVPYLVVSGVSLIWLRSQPDVGFTVTLYLFLVIWASDIGAYVLGRVCGGVRLFPAISPQKTWSGLAGGLLCAAGTGGAVAVSTGVYSPPLAAAVAVLLALAGQAGDLFESSLKRRYQVKNSGVLIPGHGGLLDRVDALIAAAPVLAILHATGGFAAS